MKKYSIIFILVLLIQLMSSVTFATEVSSDFSTTESAEETQVQELQNQPVSEDVSSNTRAAIWATTNKATNIVSAPYDNINTTIASLSAGSGFYIIERDYDYFYVNREVNGKYQCGYVKISDVNYSNYNWVSHNVFEKGVTNFSSSQVVLSGAGTANTYEKIGTIYSGETPLLILRTELNTYNNVTYAFIQYRVSDTDKFKRGWVPYSSVRVQNAVSSDGFIDNNKIFYLESAVSSKMIAASSNSSGATVSQQVLNKDGTKQLFKIEKASTGYYRFIYQGNTNLSLQVLGNQMAEGSQLGVYRKGTADAPSKAEEFEVKINTDGSFSLASRCTGRFRNVDLRAGSSANGTKIISSQTNSATNQKWHLQPKIMGGNDISIIKVGDSTGRACVSMYNAFPNRNVYYANRDELYSTTNVSKNTLFNLSHVKFAVKNSSVFYINGHGYSTPRIGFENGDDITPQNLGFSTSDRARWGVLSPCDQLNETGSAIVWANYALRQGVRGILGYYNVGPHDDGEDAPQVDKIAQFVENINDGDAFVDAWKSANNGLWGVLNESTWAAIYHSAAENDTKSTYNSAISNPTSTTIYYVAHQIDENSLTANSVQQLTTVQSSEIISSSSVNTRNANWCVKNGATIYKAENYGITNGSSVTVNKATAMRNVDSFIQENGIVIDKNATISQGTIKRSRLSEDGTCFVDEEVLGHTILVASKNDDGEEVVNMYFEVNDSGVVNYVARN